MVKFSDLPWHGQRLVLCRMPLVLYNRLESRYIYPSSLVYHRVTLTSGFR